ncbi:MAG: GPP34 family phosphoprotein [Candidatus Eisenbacteria bacterium]
MKARDKRLLLHEEITLLALRDEEGTLVSGEKYPYAVGGAVLAEVMLGGRVGVDKDKKKRYVKLLDREPFDEPLVDECLEKIAAAKKRATLNTWVTRLAGTKKLRKRVVERLCRRGILREEEGKILFVFNRKVYPTLNREPEREVLERVRRAIFGNERDLDPRTAVLVSIAHSAGLLKLHFDKRELKERKERIRQITSGEAVGRATKQAIEAMESAILVACIVPVLVAAAD